MMSSLRTVAWPIVLRNSARPGGQVRTQPDDCCSINSGASDPMRQRVVPRAGSQLLLPGMAVAGEPVAILVTAESSQPRLIA
jgi:hypothetical protein